MHLTEIEVASLEEGEALIQLMLDEGVWVSPHVTTDKKGHRVRCGIDSKKARQFLKRITTTMLE